MGMMRKNLVLFVVALGLAVPTTLQLMGERDAFVDIAQIPRMFDGFTSDNVGSIVLAKPKDPQPEMPANPANPNQAPQIAYDTLVLQRTDKGFAIGALGAARPDLFGAPVQKARVESDVFQHLRQIRSDRETLVATDATQEQLAEYGLDDAHAFVIRAVDTSGQHVVAELCVGRDAAPKGAGTEAVRGVFVRKKDSQDVVLYEWDRGWRRDVDAAGWIERVLAQLEPDRIERISLRNLSTGDAPVVFAREGQSSWQVVGRPDTEAFRELGAVRQIEVEGLVQRLRYLAVQSYERPLARAGDMHELGLYPPQIEIGVTVREDGQERVIELKVGNKLEGRNEYWLTSNESQFLMTWPAGAVTPFELDVARRMFDPAPESGKDDGKKDDGK